MTRQQGAEFEGAPTQERLRRFDLADRPLQFEVIPQVCLVADVCHFLRLSRRQFYRSMERRQLALVELDPIDTTRRFTGASVAFEIKRRSRQRVA